MSYDELFYRSFYQNDFEIFNLYLQKASHRAIRKLITVAEELYEISYLQLKYLEFCFSKLEKHSEWWNFALGFFILSNECENVFHILKHKYVTCKDETGIYNYYFLPRLSNISASIFNLALKHASVRTCKFLLKKYNAETNDYSRLLALRFRKEHIFRYLVEDKIPTQLELSEYVEFYPENINRIKKFVELGSDTRWAVNLSIMHNNWDLFHLLYHGKDDTSFVLNLFINKPHHTKYIKTAIKYNRPDFYFYLVNEKNISFGYNFGMFEYAIKNNSLPILRDLMSRFSESKLNSNLLDIAMENKNKECYEYICTKGFYMSDVIAASKNKDAFYMSSILMNYEKLCIDLQYLFSHIVTCNRNLLEQILYDIVTDTNNIEIVNVLLENGIKQTFNINEIEFDEMREFIVNYTKF